MAHVLRGMAAGLLAGCAASWMMNQFQQMQPQRTPPPSSEGEEASSGSGAGENSGRRRQQQDGQQEENATVQTAVAISRNFFEHELTPQEKQIAGPAIHYSYGSLVGALYGGLCELAPIASAGLGMPFAAAMWLLGDEIAVPALGLSKPPTEYPPRVHADALAAHFCYGLTTDLLRRVLRHVL